MLYFNCLPDVLWLLVLCGSSSWCRELMQCVILVLPDHTHLLFESKTKSLFVIIFVFYELLKFQT